MSAQGHKLSRALQQNWKLHQANPLRGAFDSGVNFASERPEVDGLGQQGLSTVLQRFTLGLRIAVGVPDLAAMGLRRGRTGWGCSSLRYPCETRRQCTPVAIFH